VSSFSVTKAATQNPITHKTQEHEQEKKSVGGGVWKEEEEKSKGDKKREEKGPAADDGEGPRRTQKRDATKDGEQRQQQPAATEVAARAKKQERGGEGSKRGSGRELHGNKRIGGRGASWERVRARFGPFFFIVCLQDPHGTTAHSLPNPKKKHFQKILVSGSPTTEF
jgi:hypothetical protein